MTNPLTTSSTSTPDSMPRPAILSLCDRTGVMARPWAEAGYDCVCVDTAHSIRRDRVETVGQGSISYVWGDVLDYFPAPEILPRVRFVSAFPPCTDLAGSGARDWERKGPGRLARGLALVSAVHRVCLAAESHGAAWMIENPVGRLATAWRPADHTFDPYEFADYAGDPASEAYTKRTCLWTGGGFVMPDPRAVVPVLGSLMHTLAPSGDRADLRSATPSGFARAVYLANRDRVALAA